MSAKENGDWLQRPKRSAWTLLPVPIFKVVHP